MRENPAWLFGVLNIPYGTFNAIVTILVPFLLRKRGFPVNEIADVVAVSSLPNVWYFLWSPVVDIGLLRRTWVLVAAGASALCAWIAITWSSASLVQVTSLLFAGNVIGMLMSSANGAVLQTMNPAVRGRASGWYQAGNLGGGALGAGATIWLAGFLNSISLGAVAGGLIALPALSALRISEARFSRPPAAALFRALAHDIWDVLKSPRTLIGLTFFLSPVGSAAVANLISSVGPDYRASESQVAFVSGVAGGILSAIGCMVGGFICDRMNRMTAYGLTGLVCTVFAVWMAVGPANAFTYTGGYTGYALGAGFAYAAFTALVLEVLGKRRHAAGSAYSLLVASGNVPITYMTWVDGVAYKHLGVKGLMGADALANGVGALVLLLFARFAARRWLQEQALTASANLP